MGSRRQSSNVLYELAICGLIEFVADDGKCGKGYSVSRDHGHIRLLRKTPINDDEAAHIQPRYNTVKPCKRKHIFNRAADQVTKKRDNLREKKSEPVLMIGKQRLLPTDEAETSGLPAYLHKVLVALEQIHEKEEPRSHVNGFAVIVNPEARVAIRLNAPTADVTRCLQKLSETYKRIKWTKPTRKYKMNRWRSTAGFVILDKLVTS